MKSWQTAILALLIALGAFWHVAQTGAIQSPERVALLSDH